MEGVKECWKGLEQKCGRPGGSLTSASAMQFTGKRKRQCRFFQEESRENLGTYRRISPHPSGAPCSCRTNPHPSGAPCSCRTIPQPLETTCSCRALSLIPLAGAPESEKNPHCMIQRAVTPAILMEAIEITEQSLVVNNLQSMKAGKHRSSLELKLLRGPSYTCTPFLANHSAFWDLHPRGTASTQLSQANGSGRLSPP